MDFNEVRFGGRLTADVILKTTQGGVVIGNFNVASNYKYKEKTSVCFLGCTAFGKTAETIEKYFGKGDPIFLMGRLDLQKWESQDGAKHQKHQLIVEGFRFCGPTKTSNQGSRTAPAANTAHDNSGIPPVDDRFPDDAAPPPDGPDNDDIPL